MRVLLLIISSPGESYDTFKETWKCYMNLHENIDSYFIELHPNIEEEMVVDHMNSTIIFRGEESTVPGCLLKTVLAIRKNVDKYNFIVRSNLSSLIHLDRLYKHIQNITHPLYYAGFLGNHHGIIFASGALFIMSQEIAKCVSNHADITNITLDDVYIGNLISQKYGHMIVPLPRQESLFHKINVFDEGCFHYRFKTSDRTIDAFTHKKCADLMYH